ncbi:MAG: septation regulator SpoVG [Oscillospiraceae bacterium]|nr:septation regulator SpoVG [Oscillospiraceae bacterium]
MNITAIRIRKLCEEEKLKAIVSITLDNKITVHDIKIVKGPHRLFVAMPSRKDENGTYRDIAHPIDYETRESLEAQVLLEYYNYVERQNLGI